MDKGKPADFSPTLHTTGMVWVREIVFPIEDYTNWLSNTKHSTVKTYIQIRLDRLRLTVCASVFRKHVYICLYQQLMIKDGIIFKLARSGVWESWEGEMREEKLLSIYKTNIFKSVINVIDL